MMYFDENGIYSFGLNHMVQHRQQLYFYHLSDVIDGQEPCIYQNSKISNDNTSVKSNKDLFKTERNSILFKLLHNPSESVGKYTHILDKHDP